MSNPSDLSSALADRLNMAKHGERSNAISVDAYEWVNSFLEAGLDLINGAEGKSISPEEAAKITYGKVGGEFS